MRDEAFGRALGRVVAHELYHVLARTLRHGVVGVAKACYSPVELTAVRFQFEPREVELLRESRARVAKETAAMSASSR
jgi:hypothetical protein